jgi:hypothetical protein
VFRHSKETLMSESNSKPSDWKQELVQTLLTNEESSPQSNQASSPDQRFQQVTEKLLSELRPELLQAVDSLVGTSTSTPAAPPTTSSNEQAPSTQSPADIRTKVADDFADAVRSGKEYTDALDDVLVPINMRRVGVDNDIKPALKTLEDDLVSTYESRLGKVKTNKVTEAEAKNLAEILGTGEDAIKEMQKVGAISKPLAVRATVIRKVYAKIVTDAQHLAKQADRLTRTLWCVSRRRGEDDAGRCLPQGGIDRHRSCVAVVQHRRIA